MENFSCRRPKPFFCDRGIAAELATAGATLDDARREALMRGLARRYQEAAPAIFLVEQIDLFARRPDVDGVVLRNRVPIYEMMSKRRAR